MKKNLKEMTKTKRSRGLASRCRLLLAALLLIIGASAQAQIPETGIQGTTVVLNDLEDHTWTYYAGVDESVDGGYYKENYEGIIYSPDPRDVEIHYKGGSVEGASAVAISGLAAENQNKMVYYLTLEKHPFEKWLDGDGSQPYPYQVISNPFSKRPAKTTDGTTTYYGFAGWKIISGGNYISEYADNDVIPLDAIIHFTNLADGNAYASGSVPNVITLEATWTEATVICQATMPTFTDGTYETNFWVMTANYTDALTLNQNMTITAQSPDGGATIANGNYEISNTITVNNTFTGTPKLEWLKLSGSANINAGGKNLYLGRGITCLNNGRTIYGLFTVNTDVDQFVKIESGIYYKVFHYQTTPRSIIKQVFVWGCDYDRAIEANPSFNYQNAYLTILDNCRMSSNVNLNLADPTTMMGYVYGKSGNIVSNYSSGTAPASQVYYMSLGGGGNHYGGCSYMEILGGQWWAIAGGWDAFHHNDDRSFTFRMKGGIVRGPVYGAAEEMAGHGIRTFAITGGIVKGWVAGGANGTMANGGQNDGKSYVYVGGNAEINSQGNNLVINRSVGGNVYGAGCGYSATSQSGEMTEGTNVVVTDNAYVERGVYGGGGFGYTTQTANIYIAGNCTIDGKYDSTTGTFGGVYGGAKQNKAGDVNIYMTGGTVNGAVNGTVHGSGVFGGSNASGVLTGNVNMKLLGGTIGTASAPANVHGGGYGAETEVTGNITVAIGEEPEDGDKTANKDEIENLTINGDVYGGSALGKTNTAGGTTAVNMYSGTVNGSVYGGALGSVSAPATIGATSQTVGIYGGKVTEAVYGGSNINASMTASPLPQQGVTVHATCTPAEGEFAIGSVFGGGNGETAAASGQPGAHDNHANGTFVTVEDGYIGNVYGGGNNATVGKGTVNINGGTFGNVFGGGNRANVINTGNGDGSTTVSITSCDVTADAVYGGCNAADMDGNANTTIWGGTIRTAFAGGNGAVSPANVGGDATLNIHGGEIGQAFAGSNTQGSIAGDMNVFIDKQAREGASQCPERVGEVYGGGNLAAGKVGTITIGCTAEIGDLYGGANQADVTGNIVLNVTQGKINRVFGGNNTSGNISGSITVNIDKDPNCDSFEVGTVYGGGNLAAYNAPSNGDYPKVNLLAGTVTNDVFGGGLGTLAVVTGNPQVNVSGGNAGNVYGGGSQANVTGNTAVNLTSGTVTGNIYGGGLGDNTAGSEVAANVSGTATVTIGGGSAANVFGCNNLYGAPQGTATVNMTGGTVGNVYGGGNLAAYTGTPDVNVTGGTISSAVYGGGYGETATINGSTDINISGATTSVHDVYGGGYGGSVTVNTTVTIPEGQIGGNVFGGGLGETAVVSGSTNVNVSGATTNVGGHIYGGGSAGPVTGETNVTVSGLNLPQCNVFGAGLGQPALVTGNTHVTLSGSTTTINNVYGGGSAGSVTGEANVDVTDAKVSGNIYGAGLGQVTTTGSTNVNVCGQTIVGSNTDGTGNVYGGGEEGDVKNGTNVIVGDDNPQITNVKNVYGAGMGAESDVKCTGGTSVNVTIKKSALVRGSVFGGSEEGTVRSGNLPTETGSTYGHGANGKKVAVVTVESGRIMGNVYGGGELGATAGQTVVNMEGGTVEGNVFGGALGLQGQTLVYGLKTVNMTDGVVLGDIYGGSERANDTNEYEGEGDEATGSHSSIFVNVSGGNIAQNVYGGGFYGTISGNVTVNIGVDAINNGTDFARNTNKLTLTDDDKKLLNIEGSIYAGSDWGEITVGGQFGPANISGYSNIYIDGAGYDMQAEMLNTSNYMNIAGSIYGAGTSSDAGLKGRRIFIRNYGLDQTATVDDALTYINCTRKLYSIQRADSVYLEDTHITFRGQGDMTSTSTTEHYAILNVFKVLRQVHNSTIDLQFPVDNIFSYNSCTLPAGKTIFNAAESDYKTVQYQNAGGDYHLHNEVVANDNNQHIDNKLRMTDGTYLYVRYPQNWNNSNGKLYGEFRGFVNMVVPLNYSFAFARPKVTGHESPTLPWGAQNTDDGGFCSYDASHNTFDANGSLVTENGVQQPYTNQLPTRDDSEHYRYWMIQGTNTETKREIVLVAKTDGDSEEKLMTITGTVTLNPVNQGGYIKIREQWGSWGEDVTTINTGMMASETGNEQWVYFIPPTEGNIQGTEVGPMAFPGSGQTYYNEMTAELAKISASPNNTFGLTLKPVDQLTKVQRNAGTSTTPNWQDVGYDVLFGSVPSTDFPFLSNHRFLAGNQVGEVTLQLCLTYSNQIDRNTVLAPMTLNFEEYDADGNYLYTTNLSIVITTQTAINQSFDEPLYAVMFGQGEVHDTYVTKATLPTFSLLPETTESTFKVKSVGDFESNLEGVQFVSVSDFNNEPSPAENQIAIELGPSLTYDNTLGWLTGYDLTNPQASLVDLKPLEGHASIDQTIGTADGRKNIGLQFVLHYNGSLKYNAPENEEKLEIGRLDVTLEFDNISDFEEQGGVGEITITIVVYKRGQGTDWYIDGIAGNNTNLGHKPDQPKYSLKGVLFGGYMPGDNIYIKNKITINSNSVTKWPEGTGFDELTLMRYPGGHKYSNGSIPEYNDCYTGPLIEVNTDFELYGITFNGLDSLNYNGKNYYIINQVRYDKKTDLFNVKASSPIIIVNGGATMTLNNTEMAYNHNNGAATDCGGAIWVKDGGTLNLADGANIHHNSTTVTGEGAGVYVNSEKATVNVMETVTVTNNTKKASGTGGQSSNSNIYLPTAESVITVDKTTGLNTNSVIGITKTVFPPIGGMTDFTPVAYSDAQHQAEEAYKAHITDDGRVYSIYYDPVHDVLSPKNIYFVKTWASEVHEKPSGWDIANIDSPEDLAWLISSVNGYNGQTAQPDGNAKLTANIDMSQYIWVPIGDSTNKFSGTFDGNGYEITGLRSNLSGNKGLGLFGTVNHGTIKNTFVTNGTLKSIDSRYLGSIAGIVENGGTVEGCEGALTLQTINRNTIMGGLVGLLDNSTLHSSIAVADLTGYRMGGLAGETKGNAKVENNYAYTKFADANLLDESGITIPNDDLVAGLVADNASDEGGTTRIDNCYVRLRTGNEHNTTSTGSPLYAFDAASKTGNSIASCYYYNGDTYNGNLTATANPTGIMPFDEAKHPYAYAENYNHVIEGSGELGNYFVDMLNKKAEDNEHAAKGWLPWFRTSSDINGDYPLPKMGYDNASKSSILLAVSSDRTDEVLHFHHSIDEAFTRYTTLSGKDGANPVVAAYANAANATAATVTVAQPDGLELYINEDVAILQPAPTTRDANPLTAHVGITLDNSAGIGGANPTFGNGSPDAMDWHMFSTPLANAPLGITYANNNPINYWQQGETGKYYINGQGYFPDDSPTDEIDFYCYFEPEYHWINFKRNGNSHWHQDNPDKIEYWYTPNGSSDTVHGRRANNESQLIRGKGYLLSSKEETSLHTSGILNNGDVVYRDVTNQKSANFPSINLLGNPYQSYLDFDEFAEANSNSEGKTDGIWYSEERAFYILLDEDKRGYVYYHFDQSKNPAVSASQYLHMHQGFFVVSEVTERTSATFTNDMRCATGTPVDFRGGAEKAAYPLINLILSEESGNKDYAVIELDRPKAGGAVKAKTVRAGAGQIYAHYNDEDYAIAFTTPGLTSIPVRFNTNRDDVFTLTWTTLNADFSYLHLIDNITGADVDCLLSDEYVFYANTYDFESRFKLVFQYTGVEENDGLASDSNFAFVSNGELVVNGEGRLECIDLQGRSLFATDLYGTQNRVALPNVASGLYLLRLINGKQIKVQKIVID